MLALLKFSLRALLTFHSQKYYKLRKESDVQAGMTPPATPKKRKASADDDEEDKKKVTPSKRARPAQQQREPIDGVLFSDTSNSPQEFKAEEMPVSVMNSFESYNVQYTPAAFFPAVNMDGNMHAQFDGQSSGHSSFMS